MSACNSSAFFFLFFLCGGKITKKWRFECGPLWNSVWNISDCRLHSTLLDTLLAVQDTKHVIQAKERSSFCCCCCFCSNSLTRFCRARYYAKEKCEVPEIKNYAQLNLLRHSLQEKSSPQQVDLTTAPYYSFRELVWIIWTTRAIL